jgi:hypothetical protein
MNGQFDLPIILPINSNPILGQIDMGQLHALGVFVIVGLVVACSVIVWKGLHSSAEPQVKEHVDTIHRDLDKAA